MPALLLVLCFLGLVAIEEAANTYTDDDLSVPKPSPLAVTAPTRSPSSSTTTSTDDDLSVSKLSPPVITAPTRSPSSSTTTSIDDDLYVPKPSPPAVTAPTRSPSSSTPNGTPSTSTPTRAPSTSTPTGAPSRLPTTYHEPITRAPTSIPLKNVSPIDCTVSDFSPWSACDKTCGGGLKIRARAVLKDSRHGGKPCPKLLQDTPCNTQSCLSKSKVSHSSFRIKKHFRSRSTPSRTPTLSPTSGPTSDDYLGVGSKAVVKTPASIWRLATIVAAHGDQLQVHYEGFSSQYDEWFSDTSGRLQKAHKHQIEVDLTSTWQHRDGMFWGIANAMTGPAPTPPVPPPTPNAACTYDALRMFCLQRTAVSKEFRGFLVYKNAEQNCFPQLNAQCQVSETELHTLLTTAYGAREFVDRKLELEKDCWECSLHTCKGCFTAGVQEIVEQRLYALTPAPTPFQWRSDACCDQCEKGKFSTKLYLRSGWCGHCPRGQFPSSIKSPCQQCPAGYYSAFKLARGDIVSYEGAHQCYAMRTKGEQGNVQNGLPEPTIQLRSPAKITEVPTSVPTPTPTLLIADTLDWSPLHKHMNAVLDAKHGIVAKQEHNHHHHHHDTNDDDDDDDDVTGVHHRDHAHK